MTRLLAVLTAVATVGALGACTDDRGRPRPAVSTVGAAAGCDPKLDAAFTAWAGAGFSGSVAISTDGRFDCLAAYGSANDAASTPNTVETVFSIGSITKAVTAATIFDLVEDGKVRLDERVGRVLPELTGAVAEVTIRQLMLHTSGLTGSHGSDHHPLDRDAALEAIGGLDLAFEPGSGYAYSNAGYTLLGLIIEEVSGVTYRAYTVSKMLRLPDGRIAGGFWDGAPAAAGPRAVGYLDGGTTGVSGAFAGPHWAVDGNGALAMTARDLASWTYALFSGRLLEPESVKAISAPGHDLGDGRSETPGWVAHDESVHGTPFLASAGGGGDVGHNAVVVWVPDKQRVFAIASNKARVSAEGLLGKVGPALLNATALPTPDPPRAATGTAPTAGKYKLDTGGAFDVTAAGDQVAVSAVGADAVAALFPPVGDISSGDLRAHEERVVALLDGRTQQGCDELTSLEKAFGPIREVTLAGTVVQHGELRTYVAIAAGAETLTGWYAVNAEGGIEAAEAPTKAPTLALAPAGGGLYRPDDPTAGGPELTVQFRDGRMSLLRSGATITAQLAG